MNKKKVFLWAIPVIMVCAYLDTLFIGLHSFWDYVYICIWEYCIFWCGFYFGEKLLRNKLKKAKDNE